MQTSRKWARLSSPDLFQSGIRVITTRHSLSPTSHTRHRIGSPCGFPARRHKVNGRGVGLAEFRLNNTTGVGAVYSPVARWQCASSYNRDSLRRTVLVQARQYLAPVNTHDVYQPFTCVHPSRQPGISSARYWQSPCHDLTTMVSLST